MNVMWQTKISFKKVMAYDDDNVTKYDQLVQFVKYAVFTLY